MSGRYYSLTITAADTERSAYYSVTPTSNLQISQGGATFTPKSASMTMVSIYPQTLQLQSPAGSLDAGVTIITTQDMISGKVVVSPPVDTEVIIALYGAGKKLGEYVLAAKEGGGVFSFPVTAAEAYPNAEAAQQALQAKLKR